jgi:hypothetical protein
MAHFSDYDDDPHDDITNVIAAAVEAGNAQLDQDPDYGDVYSRRQQPAPDPGPRALPKPEEEEEDDDFGYDFVQKEQEFQPPPPTQPVAVEKPGVLGNLLGNILPGPGYVPPQIQLIAKILGVEAAPATPEQIAANNAEQAALEQEQESSGYTPEGELIDQLPENLPGGGVQPPVAPIPAPPRIVTPTPTPTALPGTDARIAGLLNLFAGTQAPRAPQFTPQAPQAPGIGLLQQLTGLNQAQPSLGQLIQGS